MENHHFNRLINYKWTIFNSYVKLQEGTYSSIVETTATSHWTGGKLLLNIGHTFPRPLEARLPCTPGKVVPNPGCPYSTHSESISIFKLGRVWPAPDYTQYKNTHNHTQCIYIYNMLKSLIYSNLEDYHIAFRIAQHWHLRSEMSWLVDSIIPKIGQPSGTIIVGSDKNQGSSGYWPNMLMPWDFP